MSILLLKDFMHHLLICDCVRVISNKKKLESCITQQHSIKLQVKHACCFAVCLKQSHLIVLKNIGMLHFFLTITYRVCLFVILSKTKTAEADCSCLKSDNWTVVAVFLYGGLVFYRYGLLIGCSISGSKPRKG